MSADGQTLKPKAQFALISSFSAYRISKHAACMVNLNLWLKWVGMRGKNKLINSSFQAIMNFWVKVHGKRLFTAR